MTRRRQILAWPRPSEFAVETLCDHLRTALARIERDALTRPFAAAELSAELRDAVDAEGDRAGRLAVG